VAKKKHILVMEQPPRSFIGIASNQRAWEVASHLNKSLALDLMLNTNSYEGFSLASIYEDDGSKLDYEVLFFEADPMPSKAPKKAKPFRFWLVLTPKNAAAIDLQPILTKVKSATSVSLAVDFTLEKDIHYILP
jgi:hypothetical protein